MPRNCVHVLCALCVLALTTSAAAQPRQYLPAKDSEAVPNQPYARYFTTDRFGRQITFYLSEHVNGEAAPLPLIVYVHGSGHQSHFAEREGRIVPRNGHATIADVVRGRARLLIVEKPGVAFLDSAGQAPRPEFREEHTLERWAEAVSAAIKAARTLPQINTDTTLVIGHSEGGLVASKIAADDPNISHVASLAGGGPTRLFDLVELARLGHFARHVSEDPEERARHILDGYASVLEDPESTTKEFLGHSHRRWSSFLASSPVEELLNTEARIYVAQGQQDTAALPASSRVLEATLIARGKDVTADYVVDADHSFKRDHEGQRLADGWREVMTRIIDWYLERPQARE